MSTGSEPMKIVCENQRSDFFPQKPSVLVCIFINHLIMLPQKLLRIQKGFQLIASFFVSRGFLMNTHESVREAKDGNFFLILFFLTRCYYLIYLSKEVSSCVFDYYMAHRNLPFCRIYDTTLNYSNYFIIFSCMSFQD